MARCRKYLFPVILIVFVPVVAQLAQTSDTPRLFGPPSYFILRLTSYLTYREQFCYWDGANSSKDILECGIPQGSCLGPLLFLLYANDFEHCLEYMTPNMYADDTCVTIASENLNDLITDVKNELENISNWMRINKISLNAGKSEFMVVGHRRKLNRLGNELSNLILNNEVIKRVEKVKYMGINIDESLSWEEQYKTVKNKLEGGISSLES